MLRNLYPNYVFAPFAFVVSGQIQNNLKTAVLIRMIKYLLLTACVGEIQNWAKPFTSVKYKKNMRQM